MPAFTCGCRQGATKRVGPTNRISGNLNSIRGFTSSRTTIATLDDVRLLSSLTCPHDKFHDACPALLSSTYVVSVNRQKIELFWERHPRRLMLYPEQSMGKRPLTRTASVASGSSCPGGRRPGPPPKRTFVPSTEDPIDHGRNFTNDSKEENIYYGDISPEDAMAQDAGYEADVEIVRPYAIEEPDEETDQTPTSTTTPKLLESTEQWQKELLNSLRGLYCDSDSTDTPPLVRHKRGRKRKTDFSMTAYPDFHSPPQPVRDWDADMGGGNILLSPKRRRRKSARSGEDIGVSHGSLLSSEYASTTSSPPYLSPINHENERPVLKRELSAKDRMDID
ncbi:conserved hypothetical protein [Talaromyces stipitatus ATCC 10500]|uniref:Uncharacterized protein n=1 Tax=Talaromyces stipitatus (strain ATCC 10500 / CBS 375.48 / QM 6759 / NRRL 1006) TaxID=441959 RepID=B8MTJ2_TALSN|nr:uncharacterized protein TSTA_004520 [Talaromyces stipitatus ATCC 10500]EED12405.1 conserved hypothetical protein [Talaromyces stipitatus ATCC 10500]